MYRSRSIAKVVSKLVSQSLRHIFSLTGSVFLILLGISLLQIETSLETLSAITISGFLFLLLGLSGIIEFIFRIIKRYWQEYYRTLFLILLYPFLQQLQLLKNH